MASKLRPDLNQEKVFDVTLTVEEAVALMTWARAVHEKGTIFAGELPSQASWLLNRIHDGAMHTCDYPGEPYTGTWIPKAVLEGSKVVSVVEESQ